jgi:hypothetical protein
VLAVDNARACCGEPDELYQQATRPEHRTACGGGIRDYLGEAEQPNPATTLAPHRSKLTSRSWLAATAGDWFPCVRCLALSSLSVPSSILSRCNGLCKTLMGLSCFRRSHCCMAAIQPLLLSNLCSVFVQPLLPSSLTSFSALVPSSLTSFLALSSFPAFRPFPPHVFSTFLSLPASIPLQLLFPSLSAFLPF